MNVRLIWYFVFLATGFVHSQIWNQNVLDDVAKNLKIGVVATDNTKHERTYLAEITFTNNGAYTITKHGDWKIFFFSGSLIEPKHSLLDGSHKPEGVILKGQGVRIHHAQGSLFWLEPTDDFYDLPPGSSRKVKYTGSLWGVAKTDFFPNWYIVLPGLAPRLMESTAGESLEFVGPFSKPQQWKRYNFDRYNPLTAQDRYEINKLPEVADSEEIRVIPTPHHLTIDKEASTTIDRSWRIYAQRGVETEALYLRGKTSIELSQTDLTNNVIRLSTGDVNITGDVIVTSDDAYSLAIDPAERVISVKGQGRSGVFYGVQTLLSLISVDGVVYKTEVKDAPRFRYRGMLIDVGRNFRPKEDVIKLLDVMATYKLNKLHFHLTDDEGWRIQIPGLSELTEVGSKRCHDVTETKCLLPQLGSGPTTNTSGSGYYTVLDYQEILREAERRHIQVIPEITMPSHAHAAIKAMDARYEKFRKLRRAEEAREYLLSERGDQSRYFSPQMFSDNAINPCLESTFTFIDYVIQEMAVAHSQAQPLKVFHFGGNEVAAGAWEKSKLCGSLQNATDVSAKEFKELFFKRVAKITASRDLDIAGWADGLLDDTSDTPFNLSGVANKQVYAHAWDNVCETGSAGRAYKLANSGFKVVMSQASHLNFDHPYEPDPLERGNYWAARYTDTKKTFTFMPENLYANMAVKRSGETIRREEVCGADDLYCSPLNEPDNIVGIQGQLWSETIRTTEQLHSMIFPRLLALAERAWHRASWEIMAHKESRNHDMQSDWISFATAVWKRELPRLDSAGIKYRIPPPGAIIKNNRLYTTTTFHGLPVEYSTDNGTTWIRVTQSSTVDTTNPVLLRTRSTDLQRMSRVITFNPDARVPTLIQTEIDYIAEHLEIHLQILNNTVNKSPNFLAELTLKNNGNQVIQFGNWEVWFCSFTTIQSQFPGYDVITNYHMTFKLVQGCVYSLQPVRGFGSILSGEIRRVRFVIGSWRSLTRSDFFPNWYVTSQGMASRTIQNTAGEQMTYLRKFGSLKEYQLEGDGYQAYTFEERYDRNDDVTDLGEAAVPVIPTPLFASINKRSKINLIHNRWTILTDEQFLPEARFLLKKMKSIGCPKPKIGKTKPIKRVIQLIATDPKVTLGDKQSTSSDAYSLNVHPDRETITISARTRPGILNGIQTLLGLAVRSRNGGDVPEVNITDAPRFRFRGILLDVARNFQSKQEVMKVLDVMSIYKLNKLHFHLTDSQGWRLEIEGLPELTKIGGQRCHDVTETTCLLSTLGSGPDSSTSGSGFYSVSDYKEILSYAAERHIEVIPEIAIPSHAHAAVKAMQERRQTLNDKGDFIHADEFLLTDLAVNDVINPCLNATFVFVDHVIDQLVAMHRDTNPLMTFHFGGRDVTPGAWDNLSLCKAMDLDYHELKEQFFRNISRLASKHGLDLAAWEDGIIAKGITPFKLQNSHDSKVYANAWNDAWKMGDSSVGKPYSLANAGYKVVMSQATHLYFDHPQEPDPNQRGTYWATRFIDTRKVLAFTPDDVYANADVTLLGESISKEDICGAGGEGCIKLDQPQNIVGMQGNLWSETIRTRDQLEYMLFPRLLALAERAWHKAPWESTKDEQDKLSDWSKFANTVGYQELRLLDKYDIAYRIPLPGARLKDNRLFVNTEFPGLQVEASSDSGLTWRDVTRDGIPVETGQILKLATRSPNNVRYSEEVVINSTMLLSASIPTLSSFYCVIWCSMTSWFLT